MSFETAITDTQLMRRVLSRDQMAFSDLYQRYGGLVYSVAMRVLNDSVLAEEATQDTFLKVWNQSHRWDIDRGGLVTWLLTITRYTAIDRLRKEKRETPNTAVDIEDMLDLLAQYGEDRNYIDELRVYVAQLPPEQVEAIDLAFYKGLSHSEISERLGVPLGTIKSRVRMGLQKLRSLWLTQNDDLLKE
jgi:RNA polymerase sigma-70 factor, ECF subfamily